MEERASSSSTNNQRRTTAEDRNRRMFASIQGAIGGSNAKPLRVRKQPKKTEEPCEILLSCLERSICNSPFLAKMSEDEWADVCDSLVTVALDKNETDFVVDLLVPLMSYDTFVDTFCGLLRRISPAFILGDDGDESGKMPELLASIITAHWPRHLSKAVDTVNMILFTTFDIVKGWMLVVADDNLMAQQEEQRLLEAKRVADEGENVEENEGSDDDSDAPERESPLIVNRCARAITQFCMATHRSLWMKWPTLCDEIYDVIKPAITRNSNITGDVKSGLLHTLIQLHSWTKTKSINFKSVHTQTGCLKETGWELANRIWTDDVPYPNENFICYEQPGMEAQNYK